MNYKCELFSLAILTGTMESAISKILKASLAGLKT
jgi:hypothetical protein|tara:strand:+ start:238 stop:342 length:105 start_codon:yes stop_codon:yes gene_type:complete